MQAPVAAGTPDGDGASAANAPRPDEEGGIRTIDLRAPLSADPRDVSTARRALSRHLAERGVDDDVADTAVLLVSELVTNAVLHGEPPVELVVGSCSEALRIEVHDADRDSAVLLRPEPDAARYRLGGRGLRLVDSLAARWGSSEDGSGKTVWFEIDLRDR